VYCVVCCVVCPAGGSLLPYELDESRNWAMDMASLKAAVSKARAEGKCVRGLVFINPGNPTGQCLTYDNLKVRYRANAGVVWAGTWGYVAG